MARNEVDGLLSSPAHVMNAGINDQPRGAPHFVTLPAKFLVGCLVDSHADAEPLAVEPPPLTIARKISVLAKSRPVGFFERECCLEAVPGTALMQHQRGKVVQRPRRQIEGIDHAAL